MPLVTVKFFSDSLQKASEMLVILPEPSVKGPYAALYQLHGLSDDHTAWTRWTAIERYAHGLPLVVVMPDGGRGWYTNAVEGYAYESHIMKDTVGFIEKFFPVKKDRSARAIGGLSMGGYGAVKLGLKHPKFFCSVAAHSSAVLNGNRLVDKKDAERIRIFGPNPAGGPNDVFALAARLDRRTAPAIRFDCGKSDFLLSANREFHRHLTRLRIKHTYREYPGIHEWVYWDAHFPEALKFHRRNLGI
jgi:S-formylglutathione hydrolase FrmB